MGKRRKLKWPPEDERLTRPINDNFPIIPWGGGISTQFGRIWIFHKPSDSELVLVIAKPPRAERPKFVDSPSWAAIIMG